MLKDKVRKCAVRMFTAQGKHLKPALFHTSSGLKPYSLWDEVMKFSSLPCILEFNSLRCLKISAKNAGFAHHLASAISLGCTEFSPVRNVLAAHAALSELSWVIFQAQTKVPIWMESQLMAVRQVCQSWQRPRQCMYWHRSSTIITEFSLIWSSSMSVATDVCRFGGQQWNLYNLFRCLWVPAVLAPVDKVDGSDSVNWFWYLSLKNKTKTFDYSFCMLIDSYHLTCMHHGVVKKRCISAALCQSYYVVM